MPLDPAFVADCPYGPGGLYIDEILEVDRDASRVLVRMPTHDDLPITREQRVHPTVHPRHVSGGLMIHMTGIAAFAHAYHVLDLRHADGWTGYGVRIHNARFLQLALPGPPLFIDCRATSVRRWGPRLLVRYAFEFTQPGAGPHGRGLRIYEGDQTAMYLRIEAGGAGAA